MTSTQHPYKRIAESIRTQIRDGVLAEGDRLPSVRETAQEWGVATATVRNAYEWLRVEGYIRTTNRGTFVRHSPPVAPTPHHRLARLQRTGSILARGEYALVTKSGLVRPPEYVADLFGIDPDGQVICREFTTGKEQQRIGFAAHWYPAEFAEPLPDLLTSTRGSVGAVIDEIRQATGRTVKYGREAMHARHADAREASNLGLPLGSPVMAVVHEFSDEQGIIEYGEWVLPPLVTIGYEYADESRETPPAPNGSLQLGVS